MQTREARDALYWHYLTGSINDKRGQGLSGPQQGFFVKIQRASVLDVYCCPGFPATLGHVSTPRALCSSALKWDLRSTPSASLFL